MTDARIHVIVRVPLQPTALELQLGRDIANQLQSMGTYETKLVFGVDDDEVTPVQDPVIGGPVRLIISSF